MNTLTLLVGSTRPNRFGPTIAQWIEKIAQEEAASLGGFQVKVVDLEQLNLPFLDEAKPAGYRDYAHQHTKEWSALVDGSDGFIFVSPEYNHSYGAALKNALDYVFYEWNYKPLGLATYGGAAGGSRAAEHLRAIAGELKMFDLREQVMIPNYWSQLEKDGSFKPTDEQTKSVRALVRELAFWMEHLKTARAAKNAQG